MVTNSTSLSHPTHHLHTHHFHTKCWPAHKGKGKSCLMWGEWTLSWSERALALTLPPHQQTTELSDLRFLSKRVEQRRVLWPWNHIHRWLGKYYFGVNLFAGRDGYLSHWTKWKEFALYMWVLATWLRVQTEGKRNKNLKTYNKKNWGKVEAKLSRGMKKTNWRGKVWEKGGLGNSW